MASTATPRASYSLLLRPKNRGSHQREEHLLWTRKVVGQLPRRKIKHSLRVFAAAQESERRKRAPLPRPGYDTRIHWENDEDGWIGGGNNSKSKSTQEQSHDDNLMSERFSELLNSSSDSHYQWVSISLHILDWADYFCIELFSCTDYSKTWMIVEVGLTQVHTSNGIVAQW